MSDIGSTIESESQAPLEPMSLEKIQETVQALYETSVQHLIVDKSELKNLRRMNQRFFTQKQLNQIWCIE